MLVNLPAVPDPKAEAECFSQRKSVNSVSKKWKWITRIPKVSEDLSLSVEKSFPEESQVPVRNIRECWQEKSRDQELSLFCHS
jgi:hypothetical protein